MQTVNYLLAMSKSLQKRLAQLNELKNESAKKRWFETSDKTEIPVYDVKLVDKKIVAINKALFDIDHAIKASNAVTKIETNIDYQSLMSEIE